MSKSFDPQVVSANDLYDGAVVYLTADGGWSRLIGEAAIARSPDDAQALLARADQPARIVGPYLVAVTGDAPEPSPLHYRERFRITGPSIRAEFRGEPRPIQAPASPSLNGDRCHVPLR